MIHYLLSYAAVAWGHAADRVFSLQIRAIRIIYLLDYIGLQRRLQGLNILTFPNIFRLETLSYVRNDIGLYPNMYFSYSLIANARTRGLAIPLWHLKKAKTFQIIWGQIFYILSSEVGDIEPRHFRQWVQNYLFKNPFYSVLEFRSL